jgi:ATP-dependent DNA helicase RecG
MDLDGQLRLNFDRSPLELLKPDDIYQDAERFALAVAEDRRIERKPPRFDAKSMGEYFSMWANTPPDGGLLVVGVGDRGERLGFEDCAGRINVVEACPAIQCPDAKYISKRVPMTNEKDKPDFFILFRVFYHKTKAVRTVSGSAFHRVADQKRQLTEDMIRELEIDKGQIDLELEPALFAYPDEFDIELLDEFARGWRAAHEAPSKPLVEILTVCHLGELSKGDTFVPNTACALLFAKCPTKHFHGCRLRFLRFEGEHEGSGSAWNAIKNLWVEEGPIPRLIQGAEAILESQLRTFEAVGPDGKFYTRPDTPVQNRKSENRQRLTFRQSWHEIRLQ